MCFYNEVWEFFTTDKAVFFVNTQFYISSVLNNSKGKGKAIPVQAWTGPDDCRRLRLQDLKTISI